MTSNLYGILARQALEGFRARKELGDPFCDKMLKEAEQIWNDFQEWA